MSKKLWHPASERPSHTGYVVVLTSGGNSVMDMNYSKKWDAFNSNDFDKSDNHRIDAISAWCYESEFVNSVKEELKND